jgi:hypothetical protein
LGKSFKKMGLEKETCTTREMDIALWDS